MGKTRAERLAAIRDRASAEADAYLAQAEEGIERMVRARLEARADEIVKRLLGFDYRYGSWELDHCNGRSGNSAAGDWLRERSQQAVMDWLDAQAGSLPTLGKRAVDGLKDEYLRELERRVSIRVREQAARDAEAIAARIVGEVVEVDG